MSYAIIQLQGKQFKVVEGEKLVVDHLDLAEGKTLEVSDVLLVSTDAGVTVGAPTVAGALVKLTIDRQQRGKKIRVAKYKSKSRYRRVFGHRQEQSVMSVDSIKVGK